MIYHGNAFDADELPSVRIDLEMASAFLNALEPEGLFTFQTFDDRKRPFSNGIRIISGPATLNTLSMLAELNERGAGIFVTVNRTDGLGRKKRNILGIRALYVDGDGQAEPEWHLKPDLFVCRDAQHWHAYWLCSGMPLSAFETAQKRLIQLYRTDSSIFDLSRVMRVPGFLHQKSTPCLIQFEDWRNANTQ